MKCYFLPDFRDRLDSIRVWHFHQTGSMMIAALQMRSTSSLQLILRLTPKLCSQHSFHEKAVKLFLKFISHFSRQRWDRASIRTRYVGPCFDPLFAAKGWNVAISTSKSPCWASECCTQSFRIVRPQLPSSVGSRVPPRTPAAASGAVGLGAQSPQQTGSSHCGKRFIRFTGFPKREEQYGELSCDSDDGALLGPCCSLLGET